MERIIEAIVEAIANCNTSENKPWFAKQMSSDDAWDDGTYNIEEAIAWLRKNPEGLIAVIDEDSSVCIGEIRMDDSYPVFTH